MSSAKADAVRTELEGIRTRNGGRLTREAVVRFARTNRRSVLHSMFEWGIQAAAHKHWLERAQEIITRYVTIQIVHRRQSISAPYYVRDPAAKSTEAGYISTSDRLDRNQAMQIIINEMERVIANIERARNVAAALDAQHNGLSAALQQMLEEAVSLRDRLAA